ncbi:MAG: PepSY-like domain-containing protein [Treponema sp.]
MKKYLIIMLMIGISACLVWGKETILKPAEIPQEITAFTDAHFKGQKIIRAVKDTEGVSVTYDIVLENGVKLEFNRKKAVIDIEHHVKLPDSVVPAEILSYIAQEYNGETVIGWERDRTKQTVKLSNGLELEFSLKHEFIRVDR